MNSCSCSSCVKAQNEPKPPKPALGPLPYTLPLVGGSYPTNANAAYLLGGFDVLEQLETEGAECIVDNLDNYSKSVSSKLYQLGSNCSLKTYLMDVLYPVWAAGDKSSALTYDDYDCATCGHYVSKSHDFAHWDAICGTCSKHDTDSSGTPVSGCSCCSECGCEECECCGNCGGSPGYCTCCAYCGCSECECSECDECGETTSNCSCNSYHSDNSGHKHGTIKKLPWAERDVPLMPVETVPSMDDCDASNIDPIQSAADFYLLDAIKNLVRFNTISGSERTMGMLADKDRIVRNDDRLSAVVVSAQREYIKLVEHLDRNLLAYAVSVCGGELRYHRAVSDTLPSSRSAAWDAFVGIVQENGADVLFDAVDLFEDFSSGSYGGHKWAQIAQVTAQRLSGKMPAWLFVDRIITLQHNGGCVLNKKSWAVKNGMRWSVDNMQMFLNAHAGCCSRCGAKWEEHDGKCASCCESGTHEITDFRLLCAAASPGVAHMWQLAEKALMGVARRTGGELAALPVSPQMPKLPKGGHKMAFSSSYCYACESYSCSA